VDLSDLWLTSWVLGRAAPLKVIGPPDTAETSGHLEKAFECDVQTRGKDEGFPADGAKLSARNVQPGVVFEKNGLKVTAFAVDHGGGITPTHGYRADYGGRSVAFSSDTHYFEPIVEHARGVDVLVHEVISPELEERRAQVFGTRARERVIAHHTVPDQTGTIFSRVKPRLAIDSHIVPSPTTAEDLIGPTRQTYAGPLAVGYDLMTIAISDTIETYLRKILGAK